MPFDIILYAGDTPYVDVGIAGMRMFVPFRHTAELFTKSDRHPFWGFHGIDDDEFPLDAGRVHDSDWIVLLDRGFTHGTSIRCTHQGIHGLQLAVHTKKRYHAVRRPSFFENNFEVTEPTADAMFRNVVEAFDGLESRWPSRIATSCDELVNPPGIVCEYVMNRRTYRHVP